MQTKTGSFSGRSLTLALHAVRNVTIKPADDLSDGIRVRVTYDDDKDFESLDVREGNDIVFRQKGSDIGSGNANNVTIVSSGRGSITSIIGGNITGSVVVNGQRIGSSGSISSKPVTMEIEIDVPPAFPMKVDFAGVVNGRIGDVKAPLTLNASGSANATIGETKSLKLEVSGAATASCGAVSENLKLEISGSGDASVASCQAMKADISGATQTRIGTVNGNIQADMSGSSSLTISNGSAQEMEIEASGMCKVNFGGTTETLKVDASGMCNIKVEEVTSECDIDTSGMCKVDVKRRPSQSSRPGGGGWG